MGIVAATNPELGDPEAMMLVGAWPEVEKANYGETCPRDVASVHFDTVELQARIRCKSVVVLGVGGSLEAVDALAKLGVHPAENGRAIRQA